MRTRYTTVPTELFQLEPFTRMLSILLRHVVASFTLLAGHDNHDPVLFLRHYRLLEIQKRAETRVRTDYATDAFKACNHSAKIARAS